MKRLKRLLIIAIILCNCSLFAVTYYVDADTSDGANWYEEANFSFDLATPLSSASSGDTIFVAAGTYYPTSGSDRSVSFVLKPNIKLIGGFSGGETNINQSLPLINRTYLSGDIGVVSDTSDNSYHVITYDGTLDGNTIIHGFTIQLGNANDGTGGGGMYLLNGAAPLVRNCKFRKNYTTSGGAAVFLKNGPTFESCIFENNVAKLYGGAFYSPEDRVQIGDPTLSKSVFADNIAPIGSALCFEKRESVNIDSCVFWNNTDGTGTLTTFSLSNLASSSSFVSDSAIDDSLAASSGVTLTNVIIYECSDPDGPFADTTNYSIEEGYGIPTDFGIKLVTLILNIKVFFEGSLF